MDYSAVREHALGLPETREDFPFGPEARVFKVADKMFGLLSVAEWHGQAGVGRLNLKCDPAEALMLRDLFAAVIPGYHMNKTHWNSVMLDGTVPTPEIARMIDRSYGLVVKSLPRATRRGMELRWGEAALYR